MLRQIVLCGFGGQGVVLAGNILARASFEEGNYVASVSSYGAAARGSACNSEIVISDRPIIFPRVIEADVMIALSQTAFDANLQVVKKGGIISFDPDNVCPGKSVGGKKYYSIPATRKAVQELNSGTVANTVMLGATAKLSNLASIDALALAIRESVRPEHIKLNLRALEVGFKLDTVEEGIRTRREGVYDGSRE